MKASMAFAGLWVLVSLTATGTARPPDLRSRETPAPRTHLAEAPGPEKPAITAEP